MIQRLLMALSALVAMSAAPAFAQDATTTTPDHRVMGPLLISQGNLEVGGGGYYQSEADNDGWQLDISPKVEYFVLNRFSVGGTVRYFDAKFARSQFEIGPSITYYLTHTSKWAISVDQSIRYVKPEGGNDNYLAGETGLAYDYFITESLALGPAVKALYYFNGDTTSPGDATRFLVNFSLFL